MKEAPHEKMKRDETEYAERGAKAYAVCCSQRDLDDETELRSAFYAGFKSACAYLRSPGIGRAEIVVDDATTAPTPGDWTTLESIEGQLGSLVRLKHDARELRLLNAGTDRPGEHHWRFVVSSGRIVMLRVEAER